jgi:hypothetical protein
MAWTEECRKRYKVVGERAKYHRNRSTHKKTQFLAELKDRPCLDCGGKFPPECMDFDHVRGEKLFGVGTGVTKGYATILAEIEKCEIVCANCHRIRTKSRRRANANH